MIVSSANPTNGLALLGPVFNWALSTPSFSKADEYKISAELPLSISTRCMVKLEISNETTKALV